MKQFSRALIGGLFLAGLPLAAVKADYVIQSSTTLNGVNNSIDEAKGMARDQAGNIYVTGYVKQGANNEDIWIAKYNSNLVLLSSRTMDGGANRSDMGYDIEVAVIGAATHVFVTGYVSTSPAVSARDMFIGDFASDLTVISSRTFNIANDMEEGRGVAYSGASFLVTVVGYAKFGGTGRDTLIAQFDPALGLNPEMFITTNTSGANFDDEGEDIVADSVGNVYVTGYKKEGGSSNQDVFLAKLNTTLGFLLSTSYGSGFVDDFAKGIALSPNQTRLLVTGRTGATPQGYLAMFNTGGLGLLDDTFFGNSGGPAIPAEGNDVAAPSNTEFYVAGKLTESSDAAIFTGRFTEAGGLISLVSSTTFSSGDSGEEAGQSLIVSGSTNIYVAGNVASNTSDIALVYARLTQKPQVNITHMTSDPGRGQYQIYYSTVISVNEPSDSSSSVVLKGLVSDQEGDTVMFQVYVATYTGQDLSTLSDPVSPTLSSGFVASGTTVTLTVTDLSPGTSYYWQARSVDVYGSASPWQVYDTQAGKANFITFSGARQWNASVASSASVAGAWLPKGPPRNGDSIMFATSFNCAWDVPGTVISTMTLPSGFSNTVTVHNGINLTYGLVIRDGTFNFNTNTTPIDASITMHDGDLYFSSNTGVLNGTLTLTGSLGPASVYLGDKTQTIAGNILMQNQGTSPFFDLGYGTHTFRGNLTVDGGTINEVNSRVIFVSTGPQTISGAQAIEFNHLVINTSGTVLAASPLYIWRDLNMINGTFDTGSSTHTIQGSVMRTGGTMNNSQSTWTFTGPNPQTIASTLAWGALSIEKFSCSFATVSFSGASVPVVDRLIIPSGACGGGTYGLVLSSSSPVRRMQITKDLVVNDSSAFHVSGSTIEFTGATAGSIQGTVGTVNLGNVVVNKSAGIPFTVMRNIHVAGNFSLQSGNLDLYTGTHDFAGNWTQTGGDLSPSTSTVLFEVVGGPTITQYISMTGGGAFNDFRVDDSSVVALTDIYVGGLFDPSYSNNSNTRFNPNGHAINLEGDLAASYYDKTLVPSGTFYFLGAGSQGIRVLNSPDTLNMENMVVNGASVTLQAGNHLDLNGSFTLLSGSFSLAAGTHTVGGQWTESAGEILMAGTTVTFDGPVDQYITQNLGNHFHTLWVDKTSGIVGLSSDLEINANFRMTSGGFDTSGKKVTLKGDFPSFTGSFNSVGEWVFAGTGDQIAGPSTFDDLTLQNSGNVSFPNASGGYGLTVLGDLAIGPASALVLSGGNNNIRQRGHLISSGAFSSAYYWYFDGTSDQNVWDDGNNFGTFHVDKVNGSTMTLLSGLTMTDVILDSGVFNPGSSSQTVSGNFTQSGGTFAPASGKIAFVGGPADKTLTLDPAGRFWDMEVAMTGGATLILQSALTVGNTLQYTTNGLNATNREIKIGGDFIAPFNTNGLVLTGSTLTFNGAGAQKYEGVNQATAPYHLHVNKTGGVLSLNGPLSIQGNLTITAGTLSAAATNYNLYGDFTMAGGVFSSPLASTWTFAGGASQWISASGASFGGFMVSKTPGSRLTALAALDINGNFSLSGGTFAAGGFNHALAGNWDRSGSSYFAAEASTVTFDGAGSSSLTGGTTFQNLVVGKTGGADLNVVNDIDVDGNLSVISTARLGYVGGDIYLGGNYTYDGVSINYTGGSKLVMEGAGTQLVNGSQATAIPPFFRVNGPGTVNVTSNKLMMNVQIDGGVLSFDTPLIDIMGSWTQNSGTFQANSNAVRFIGGLLSGPRTISQDAGSPFHDMEINMSTSIFVVSGGMGVAGDFILTGGTLAASVPTEITVLGDWTQSGGRFDARDSTVTFSGSGTSDITTLADSPFDNLQMAGTALFTAQSDLAIGGVFTKQGGGTFVSGAHSHTVSGGLSLNGSSANWNAAGSVWIFDGGAAFTLPDGFVWGSVLANNATLAWAGDSAAVNDLTVSAASTLNLANKSLLVDGDWDVQGTFTATNSTVTFTGSDGLIVRGGNFAALRIDAESATDTVRASTPVFVSGLLTVARGELDLGSSSHTVSGALSVGAEGRINLSSAVLTVQGGAVVSFGGKMILPASNPKPVLALGDGSSLQIAGELVSHSGSNLITAEAPGDLISMTALDGSTLTINGLSLQRLDANGLVISANAVLSVFNNVGYVDFQAGAKAVQIDGSALSISTFTGHDFSDTNLAFNVYAPNLASGNLYMQAAIGASSGPSKEHDPNHRVFWDASLLATTLTVSTRTPTSLTWAWTDLNADEQGYRVLASSDTSDISGLLAPDTTSWLQAGLAVNTPYSVQLRVFDILGSSLTQSVTFYTLAAPPASSAFSQVFISSVNVSWAENGNPAGTQYLVEIDTDQAGVSLDSSGWAAATSHVFQGLAANTSYYVRVQARNGDGLETVFDTPVATSTLAQAPLAAVFVSSGVNMGSVTFRWTTQNPGNTLFEAMASTDSGFSSLVASHTFFSSLASTETIFTGLAENTTHYFRVRAVNQNNVPTDWTAASSTSSLALAPSGEAIAAVNISSLSFTWNATNTPGTIYQAALAQDSGFTAALSTTSLYVAAGSTGAVFTGLTANTTYYFRTRAVNNDGVASGWSGILSTVTLVGPPASLAFVSSGVAANAVTFRWNTGNAITARYEAEVSTDSGFVTTAGQHAFFSSLSSTETTFTGLTENTTHYFRVRAVSQSNVPTEWTSALSTATLALAPTGPFFGGVAASSMAFAFTAPNAPPTLYQAVLALDSGFSVGVSTSEAFTAAGSTQALFSGLNSNTLHYLRARAVNHNGVATAWTSILTTSTLANAPASMVFVSSGVNASDIAFRWQTNNAASTLYEAHVAADSGFTTLVSSHLFTSTLSSTETVFTPLSSNTTYYFRARAINNDSVPTDWTGTLSTSTLASAPAALAPVFVSSGVNISSITFGWQVNSFNTLYETALSTDSGFAAAASTVSFMPVGVAGSTETVFTNLIQNTTYHFRVRALNNNGVYSTAFSASTSTLALPPSGEAFTLVAISSVSLAWNTGGAVATRYEVAASTDSGFAGAVLTNSLSSSLATGATTFTGLTGNTTYYFRLRAMNNNDVPTAWSPILSTVTLVGPPSSIAFSPSDVNPNTVTFRWNTNNSVNTRYEAVISTDSGFLSVLSTHTFYSNLSSTETTFTGLVENTTHYFRARAVSESNVPTVWTSALSTATLALAPTGETFNGVGISSLSFAWNAVNTPATLYEAQIAEDPGFSVGLGTGELFVAAGSTEALFTPLSSNVAYYLRARAVNHNGVATAWTTVLSTVSLANAPTALVFISSGVSENSLVFRWQTNNAAPTIYEAQLASDSGFSPVLATHTFTTALSSTETVFNTLSGNATYYLRARAVNDSGAVTAWTSTLSTSTLATAPSTLTPIFVSSGVGISSITFRWQVNNVNTIYETAVSTDTGFAAAVSTVSFMPVGVAVSTETVFTGLTQNTTYHFRVRALNNNGVYSTAFTASTSTLAVPPSGGVFTLVAVSSISLTWNTGGTVDTRFEVAASTDNAFAGTVLTNTVSSSLATGATTFLGLTGNTTYYFRVRALNHNDVPTGWTVNLATVTLVGPPAALVFVSTGVNATDVTFRWETNNSVSTRFEAVISTDSGFTPPLANHSFYSNLSSTETTFTGLVENTTHYFRVRAVSESNVPTAWTMDLSTATLALAPAGEILSAVAVSSMGFNWTATNTPGTRYEAQIAQDSGFSLALNTTSLFTLSGSTGGVFTGLSANTTHFLRARAVNHNGVATAWTTVLTTPTWADLPATAPFLAVSATQLTAAWSAAANPAGTQYVVQLSTDSFSTVAASSLTLNTSAVFSGLTANTTYHAQVKAINHAGVATAYQGLGSTVTLPNPPTGMAFAGATVNSLSMTWSANGNPAGSLFVVELSSGDFSAAFSGDASSSTLNTNASFTGLAANTTYYSRVKAVSNGGTSSAYTAPLIATATLANAPAAVVFSLVAETTVTLSWSANGNPAGTRYVAEISTGALPNVFTGNILSPVATPSAVFTGLAPVTHYFAQVKAVNHNSVETSFTAPASSTQTTDATPPTVSVLDPNASEEGATLLATLSGTAADATPGSGLLSVQIRISNGTNDWNGAGAFAAAPPLFLATSSFSAGAWTYDIATTAWSHGVNYSVIAKVSDIWGNVTYATRTFTADSQPPNAVASVAAANTGFPGTIQLSWTSPAEDGASANGPAFYEIRYSSNAFNETTYDLQPAATGPYTGAATLSGNPFTANVGGLTDGVTYYFHVKSVDNAGNVSPMDTTAGLVFAYPGDLTAPNAITTLAANPTGIAGEVELTWNVPQEFGRYSVPLLFHVRYATTATISEGNFMGFTPAVTINVDTNTAVVGAAVNHTLTGLAVGSNYFFFVKSEDSNANVSTLSNMGFAAVTGDALAPAAINDLAGVTGSEEGEIDLTWTVPEEDVGYPSSGAPVSYDVRVATYSFGSAEFSSMESRGVQNGGALTGGQMTATISGLTPGTTYYIRIKGIDDAGNIAVVDATSPQAAAKSRETGATVIGGWVGKADNTDINLVLVEAITTDGTVASTDRSEADGQWRLEGLTAGQSYTVKVSWTVDEVTSSAFLESVSAGTSGLNFNLEITVELASLTGVVALASRSAAPAGAYGAPVASVGDGYVEIFQTGQKIGTVRTDARGGYTVPNLLPGRYTVRAFNGLTFSDPMDVTLTPGQTLALQFAFELLPPEKVYCYPNPARTDTVIRFESLTQPLEAQALVFDVAGALVRELTGEAASRTSAEVSWRWDLANGQGEPVASGVYLVHVKVFDPATGRRSGVIKKLAIVR